MKLQNRKSFTLIELIIVIALIAITAVFAIPAFDHYGSRAEISSTAEQIQAAIEKAHSNSITILKGSNEIHIWFMLSGANGDVVAVYPYNQSPSIPPNPTPDSPPAEAEKVKILPHMYLTVLGGTSDQIWCIFKASKNMDCHNYTRSNQDLGSSFDLFLSSSKTDLKYKISIYNDPFIVRVNAI